MTPTELRRARMIHKSLSLRINMVRAKLRVQVVKGDVLCLDLKGGHALDDDSVAMPSHVINERIVAQRLRSTADKLALFSGCVDGIGTQVFSDFLSGMNVGDELNDVTVPLVAALERIAADAVRRHLKAQDAWALMAKAFNGTKDAVTGFAVTVGKSGLPHDEVEHEEASA